MALENGGGAKGVQGRGGSGQQPSRLWSEISHSDLQRLQPQQLPSPVLGPQSTVPEEQSWHSAPGLLLSARVPGVTSGES